MARKTQTVVDNAGSIPGWFMTYSDVITLLMTFFILLLTFASNEPESFERMKTSMFGGRGSMGFASLNHDSQDRESLILRLRSRNSRLAMRGTETPPMYSDPALDSVNLGLKTIEESSELARLDRFSFEPPLASFATDSGELTETAKQYLSMLATQMKKLPLDLRLEVARPEDLPAVIEMCDLLTNGYRIPTGRISASIASTATAPRHGLRLTIIRSD